MKYMRYKYELYDCDVTELYDVIENELKILYGNNFKCDVLYKSFFRLLREEAYDYEISKLFEKARTNERLEVEIGRVYDVSGKKIEVIDFKNTEITIISDIKLEKCLPKAIEYIDIQKNRDFHREYVDKLKKKASSDIENSFYNVYELDGDNKRAPDFLMTSFVINPFEEDLVMYIYRNARSASDSFYTLFLVKKETEFFIKCVNMKGLEDKAREFCSISNCFWCEDITFGKLTSEYKKFVLEEAMKEFGPLNSEEIKSWLSVLGKIDFDKFKYDMLVLKYPKLSLYVLDYHNGKHFYADDYCLKKYSDIIDFVNYLYKACDIGDSENDILGVDNLIDAQERVLHEYIERQNRIL